MSCNNCGNVTLPNGSNGLNGYNAFTITTASFVMPAVGNSVSISVSASGQYTGVWAILGQIIYISDGTSPEYYEVTTAGTQTTIGVKNLGYVGTTPTTVASGAKVSPAGVQGAGTNGTNGTTLLGVSHAAATLNGLVYATFSTGTIPITAAQMSANDDSVEIKAKLYLNATLATSRANVRILVGGVSITLFPVFAIENSLTKTFPYIDFKIVLTRASATTANIRVDFEQSAFGLGTYSNEIISITSLPNKGSYEILAAGAITWASGNNIEIQGLVSNVADTVKLGFYEITSVKKV